MKFPKDNFLENSIKKYEKENKIKSFFITLIIKIKLFLITKY